MGGYALTSAKIEGYGAIISFFAFRALERVTSVSRSKKDAILFCGRRITNSPMAIYKEHTHKKSRKKFELLK